MFLNTFLSVCLVFACTALIWGLCGYYFSNDARRLKWRPYVKPHHSTLATWAVILLFTLPMLIRWWRGPIPLLDEPGWVQLLYLASALLPIFLTIFTEYAAGDTKAERERWVNNY